MEPGHTDRLRRLRAARATGKVPADLVPWLCAIASASLVGDEGPVVPPAEALALRLSAEADRMMTRRGLTHRTVGASARSLARVLKGADVRVSTVADIADAMNCDVEIRFRPRERYLATPGP